MKYVLLIAEFPKGEPTHEALKGWHNFEEKSHELVANLQGVEACSRSVYVCDLGSGLHNFASLLKLAKDCRVRTRTLFFDQKPPFVISE